MDITRKSIAVMLDDLITTNIKCFMAQEKILDNTLTEKERFEAAVKTQILNVRRNQLLQALDKELDPSTASVTGKTYGENK